MPHCGEITSYENNILAITPSPLSPEHKTNPETFCSQSHPQKTTTKNETGVTKEKKKKHCREKKE